MIRLCGAFTHVAVGDVNVVVDPFIDSKGGLFATVNYRRIVAKLGWTILAIRLPVDGKLPTFDTKGLRSSRNALDHLRLVWSGRDCMGVARHVLRRAGFDVPFWVLTPELLMIFLFRNMELSQHE